MPDTVAEWVVLVDAYDRTAVEQAKTELLDKDGLIGHGASANPMTGLYSLDYTIGDDEVRRAGRKP